MSEYKSGGIAALFPKPKKQATESGKKLQSLFKEFHNVKECKNLKKESEKQGNKELFILKHPDKSTERANKKAKKKRKISDVDLSFLELSAENSSLKNQKLNEVKTEFQNNDSLVNISTDAKAQIGSLKAKPFPRKKIKPSIKKGFAKNAFKSELSDSVSSHLKQGKNYFIDNTSADSHSEQRPSDVKFENNELNFSKKAKHLNSDGKIDKSKLLQASGQMLQKYKITKAKKQRNELFHNNVLSNKLDNKNSSRSNSAVKDFFTGGDSEDFIKLSRTYNFGERSGRNIGNTVFVGNLPLNVTKKALKDLFSRFGEIVDIRIRGIIPAKSKLPLKIAEQKHQYHASLKSLRGFIEFKYKQNVADALVVNGTFFKGNHIFVNEAASGNKLYDNKLSVFLGNLPFDVSEEAVWTAFASCGPIQCIRIVRDSRTGISKGFGYVMFNSPKAKQMALNLQNLEIGGRAIRVKNIESKNSNQKTPMKQFDSFKSKALKLKKKQEGNSTSRKSVKKIKKQLKISQKQKQVASFLLNTKRK